MRQIQAASRFACAAIIACVLAPPVHGQTVYRCANTYSQTPCPGAVLISVDDSRTPGQKAQTDAAAAQAARMGDQMEKDRLARERAVARASTSQPVRGSGRPATTAPKPKTAGRQKARDPEPFTAYGPPADQKATKKKAAGTSAP